MIKNKSQIWIETAIYTLIGLTIIAIVLSIAAPQIEKIKEKIIIKQTITALDELNNEIQKVGENAGTIKIVLFKITKGKLEIKSNENKITYSLVNTNLEFSEEGQKIKEGDLTFYTEKQGRRFNVFLELGYENLNITFNGREEIKTLSQGTYKIQLKNVGDNPVGNKTHIDFMLV